MSDNTPTRDSTLHFHCSCGAFGHGNGDAREAIEAVAKLHYYTMAHEKVELWERGKREEGRWFR